MLNESTSWCLSSWKQARHEGVDRALVQMATGVGKTYLSAFDSRPYPTVLFVAHREEILKQALRSFYNVRGGDRTAYGFFMGERKDTNKKFLFASVATLGQAKYLSSDYYAPDAFSYIVIDEFHHAVNQNYQHIIDYFHPKFLLGLTATPERLDGRDIFALCDYNVPYELSIGEAINRSMLAPFHYYGIYDPTDYSNIHTIHGHYKESDLEQKYLSNLQRTDLIIKHFQKHHPRCAIGFCASRKHAKAMAKAFQCAGIPSAAVYSNATPDMLVLERTEAIRKLKNHRVPIFS